MAKPAQRLSARAFRPARTPVHGIRATLGNLQCTLANLSITGAMLRVRTEVPVGREAALVIDLPTPIKTTVRVVRCEAVDVALPGAAVWRKQDFALGVHFLDVNSQLAAAIRSLTKTGIEHSQARVLVVGEEDDVTRLLKETLAHADYAPRILTHPRYAVSTAKRIGAKAVVIHANMDPQCSVRPVIDALRADHVTAAVPIVLCAQRSAAQECGLAGGRRVRVLLVPFTPEELVATVDRAIDELS